MSASRIARLRARFPLFVIAAAFLWAVLSIQLRGSGPRDEEDTVLRIAHWQLEAGVRTALDELARDYEALHPGIRIEQEAIPDAAYGAWVSTQLMGGNPPDLIEVGGGGLPYTTWVSFYTRYFRNLGDLANRPNPYNAGTPLEGIPLRKTYIDGMRAGHSPELLEYVYVPLSMFGMRLFYNRDLLRELAGIDAPPEDYRGFLAMCAKIAARRMPDGKHYVPVAASKWHLLPWEYSVFDPITYEGMGYVDTNRDLLVAQIEFFAALHAGRAHLDMPPFRARFEMLWEVCQYFQPGFTGLQRDDGLFLFAQEKAVCIPTGTWDAMSLSEQCEGRFDVGIMHFPWPASDDPAYGGLVPGPAYETPGVGFCFGAVKGTKHPEVATDFLLYLASQPVNEKLNEGIGWIPAIQGAKLAPMLEAFKPQLVGMYPALSAGSVNLQGETWIRYLQLYSLLQVRQITVEEFIAQFQDFYLKHGMNDFEEVLKDIWRGMISENTGMLALRSELRCATGERTASLWTKYRLQLMKRVLTMERNRELARRLVAGSLPEAAMSPYEHRPEALARVRETVRRDMEKAVN